MQPANDDIKIQEHLRIASLIAGFMRHHLTAIEHDELDDWVNASPRNMALFEELTEGEEVARVQKWFRRTEEEKAARERLWRRIRNAKKNGAVRQPPFRTLAFRWMSAASVAGLFMAFLWLQHKAPAAQTTAAVPIRTASATPSATTVTTPAAPYLLLDHGDTVHLSSTPGDTTLLTLPGGQEMEQQGARLVSRSATTGSTKISTAYNTLIVPANTRFQLKLGDGTLVWVNAASSLRYPVHFSSTDRTVILQGEAYFEVEHEATRPFHVVAGGTNVEVLGTHFNVNAYDSKDGIKTTLLQGRVKVGCAGGSKVISPGEQARSTDQRIEVKKVEVEMETAWVRGLFVFRNTTVPDLLAQLSRWYGVTVVCTGPSSAHFNATLSRTEPLARLLQLLNATGNLQTQIEPLVAQP